MNLLANQQAAELIDSSYIDLESALMQNIVRHLKGWNQPIASDKWQLQRLAEIGKLNQENIKLISKLGGISQTAAERMLQNMAEEAIKAIDPGLQYLAKQNLAGEAVAISKSQNVEQTVKSMNKQAKDILNKSNTTMLYKAQDAYKGLVKSVVKTAGEIAERQSFLDVLNKHVTAATIGAESRQQAMRKCIREFNEKGIPAFVDKKGRNWSPEAYVNMTMRNTAKNTADEVQTARCKDAGVNLIAIDSHSGARPKCAKDQGKIFSLDNTSGYTEDANGKKIKYDAWSSSSYGELDGILGINCGHHKRPFVPGVNIQRYFPTEEMDANNTLYKETQVQRALERDVRKQKRECMLYDELGDQDAFEDASVKLKQKEAKLKNFVDSKEHLFRRKDREQVVGFDKSVSTKAVVVAQEHYKEWAKSIGAETGPKKLAGYYDLKYNDGKESRLYKGYVKAVNKGNISPLVGYDKYKEISAKAEKALVGNVTSDGKEIKGISIHLTDRLIGQQTAGDIPKSGKRMGVNLEDVKEALTNGEAGPVKKRDDGKRGQQFTTDKCKVSFNPDTNIVIQVSPRGGKR